MPTYGEKSVYKLEDEEANHIKSLNERFARWQEKQITLLTFSINLIFTLSIAAVGLIINNFDQPLFKDKFKWGYSLAQTASFIITIAIILGVVALFCRLFDFRLTKNSIRKRTFLFKVKNKIKYEHCKELTEKDLQDSITKLNCWTKCLGNATWLFFIFQTLFFLTGILIIVCTI